MLTCEHIGAEVAELADAQDLGSCGRKAVEVQLLSSAIPLNRACLNIMARFWPRAFFDIVTAIVTGADRRFGG